MKIELKNIKTYPRMSEETAAFDATLYVDDVKVGTASNNGQGGANRIDCDRALQEKMEAFFDALPPESGLPMDLDFFISTLVMHEDIRKQAKSMIKGRIVFENKKGELMQTSKMTPEGIAAYKPRPGDKLLDEASLVAYFLKQLLHDDADSKVKTKTPHP